VTGDEVEDDAVDEAEELEVDGESSGTFESLRGGLGGASEAFLPKNDRLLLLYLCLGLAAGVESISASSGCGTG